MHGIPGILGSDSSMVFGMVLGGDFVWWRQALVLAMTLSIAIVGGLITGWVMKAVVSAEEADKKELFEDAEHWEKEHEE